MTLSNAEKQAAYRARRDAKRKAEIEALRDGLRSQPDDGRDQEIARLRAENERLRLARPPEPTDVKKLIRRIGQLEHELRMPFVDGDAATHVAALGKRIPADDQLSRALLREILDDVRNQAPEKIRRINQAVEGKLTKLVARLPSKVELRRLKIAALAGDPGATDGERAAAAATLKRLKAAR